MGVRRIPIDSCSPDRRGLIGLESYL